VEQQLVLKKCYRWLVQWNSKLGAGDVQYTPGAGGEPAGRMQQ